MLVTSGSARIAYEVQGTGSGADVCLVHGGVTDRRAWGAVVHELAPSHRCLTYDQRGAGESQAGFEEGWSPVGDALRVLDAAGGDKPVVVANSLGATIAVDLALARPERVSGLVLIAPGVSGAPPLSIPPGRVAEAAEALDESDLDAVNRFEAWLWLDGWAGDEGRVSGQPRRLFLEMNGRILKHPDLGPAAPLPDSWNRLHELRMPTLALVGELDLPHVHLVSERIASLAPRGTVHTLPGVAHLPHLEADPLTLELIQSFLEEGRLPEAEGPHRSPGSDPRTKSRSDVGSEHGPS